MANIFVSGLINIETTLKVDGFPIHYSPVNFPFFGIDSTVSGVGFNIAKALKTLGDSVCFMSIIGKDYAGQIVQNTIESLGISPQYCLQLINQTCQSVILYDTKGKRQIYTDLKDIQNTAYPIDRIIDVLPDCSIAVLCNINFSRPFLQEARHAGIRIASDVHTINNLDDPYNHDFMSAADILFMSDEQLPCSPEDWARRMLNHFGAEIIAIGLGSEGVLLSVRRDNFLERIPAYRTRPVVNTIGAGDALLSAFLHYYINTENPYQSMHKAMLFTSYKIGENGAANGFLDESRLESIDTDNQFHNKSQIL